jgi:hypothetical protein
VCVTATDVFGESDTACTYAVVYDPSGGFVTGGGWFNSPEGAYESDPSLSGKATFGFVSRYNKRGPAPIGNTEFQLHAGDLNLRSDNYQWLVVTGHDNAKFKGAGTINGIGGYQFQVWIGDGNPDTFRIKIWTQDEYGAETVVYDNGPDQAIDGGNIVVHLK